MMSEVEGVVHTVDSVEGEGGGGRVSRRRPYQLRTLDPASTACSVCVCRVQQCACAARTLAPFPSVGDLRPFSRQLLSEAVESHNQAGGTRSGQRAHTGWRAGGAASGHSIRSASRDDSRRQEVDRRADDREMSERPQPGQWRTGHCARQPPIARCCLVGWEKPQSTGWPVTGSQWDGSWVWMDGHSITHGPEHGMADQQCDLPCCPPRPRSLTAARELELPIPHSERRPPNQRP